MHRITMDESSIQIPEGVDGVKKSKSRRKKRSKKQVSKKDEAESRSQMNENLKACDDAADCEEMGILETDLTMNLLSENVTVCTDSLGNLYKGNGSRRRKKREKRNKNAKVKDEVQSLSQLKMDAVLMEIKPEEIKVDVQSIVQTEMDEREVENECIREATIEKTRSMGDQKMVKELLENLTEGDMTVGRKRKKKKKKKKKREAKIKDESEGISPVEMDEGSTENLDEGIADGTGKGEDEDIRWATIGEEDKNNLVAELTEIFVEKDVPEKKMRKKKKKKRKANSNSASESVNLIEMEKGSTEENTEGIANDEGEGESGIIEKATTIGEEVQRLAKHKVVTELTANLAEGDVVVKTKKKRKKKKKKRTEKIEGAESINQYEMDNGATKDLTEVITTSKRERKRKRNTTVEIQNMDQPEMKIELVENLSDGNATRNLNQQSSAKTTAEDVVKDLDQNKMAIKRRKHKKARIYEVQSTNEHESVPKFHLPGAEYLYSKMVPVASIRRKLLVLDVNGLLADVMMPAPKHCRREWDIRISGRAIFRRPFCNDFLKFCFENFEVGIWSSRSRQNIDKIVNYLVGDLQEKLLFCWDMSHCTQTGFKTLENYHKPLVCKELRKIWENDDPNSRWKRGDFDESNTLLVDDSPYKALLNPLNTAIFPPSYHYTDKSKDTSLGPKGDIRAYLEELAKCENVQKYVEQHPFGGKAIDEQNLSWGFYSKVVDRMSTQMPS